VGQRRARPRLDQARLLRAFGRPPSAARSGPPGLGRFLPGRRIFPADPDRRGAAERGRRVLDFLQDQQRGEPDRCFLLLRADEFLRLVDDERRWRLGSPSSCFAWPPIPRFSSGERRAPRRHATPSLTPLRRRRAQRTPKTSWTKVIGKIGGEWKILNLTYNLAVPQQRHQLEESSMRIRPIALFLSVAMTPGFAITAQAGTARTGYDVTILENPSWSPGALKCNVASGLNAFGQTAGYSSSVIGWDAVTWSPLGKATVLQDPTGAGWSLALGINDAGWSVGFSLTVTGDYSHSDAVLWSPTGKATVLQDAGGQGRSQAYAINALARSVGFSATASGSVAVQWSRSGKETGRPACGGRGFSHVSFINAFGWSVGYSYTATGSDAVLWSRSGKATVLQDAGGQGNSVASSLNAFGWSIG